MGQTIVEKIAQRHATWVFESPLRAGDFVWIRPRHVLTHDNTAAVIDKFRRLGASRIHDATQPVIALDHDIQNRSRSNLEKYRDIESFAEEHGLAFHPAGNGIGHQIVVEGLYAVPGALVVASDSHANTYGAVSALGTPVVRTDAAVIWATGSFWWQIPPTVRVDLEGRLPDGTSAKDVILVLCGEFGQEVRNTAVEFGGPGVAGLSMDERLTLANMTTEWGALTGWFPTDAVTLAYLADRRQRLARDGRRSRFAIGNGCRTTSPIVADADARYAGRITLDLATVTPHVTGPDTIRVARPLAEIESQRITIDKAYLVSCCNARTEDLASAARVLRGKRIAPGVELYLAAASREIQRTAEASGDWQTLLDAGARPLPPGCGPCIGLGEGLLEPGEVGLSATNRNFRGRMGSPEARCYLGSPAVVAASAAAGYIRGPDKTSARILAPRLRSGFEHSAPAPSEISPVALLDGFPRRIGGRLVVIPREDVDTDGIVGKEHVYRDDLSDAELGRALFANYDASLGPRLRRGDILLAGDNFGTGSSREQAVTALLGRGIVLVVAGSFAQTYLRNAFNNGLACIRCPDLLRSVRNDFPAESLTPSFIPDLPLEVDFRAGTATWAGKSFSFAPLGRLAQSLVVAGGVENRVRRQLRI